MFSIKVLCVLSGLVIVTEQNVIQKRELFREAVLPHAGGKIPDSTFRSDRLFLNRLQSEGIALPDGIVFEQRPVQTRPYLMRSIRPTFRVSLSHDGRFVAPEGRYKYPVGRAPSIETTYAVPQITDDVLSPPTAVKPYYVPLTIPSPSIRGLTELQSNDLDLYPLYLTDNVRKPRPLNSLALFRSLSKTPIAKEVIPTQFSYGIVYG